MSRGLYNETGQIRLSIGKNVMTVHIILVPVNNNITGFGFYVVKNCLANLNKFCCYEGAILMFS